MAALWTSPTRRSCRSASARDEIAAAIRDHQVVIVAGETGSGKTTQLPKICLELGRGGGRRARLIGHTQPRRIAARSVAERIAEELGTELGDLVGYKVRFTDRTSKAGRVKLMTDGILLAELQGDRQLRKLRHDHHRRGARAQPQHRLPARLPQAAAAAPARPEGRHHVGDDRRRPLRRATSTPPVVEVSGRTYPVEVRYRPAAGAAGGRRGGRAGPARPDRGDPRRRSRSWPREGPGDVLVFLPGEREIRDTADELRRPAAHRDRPALLAALRRRAAPGVQQPPESVRRVVLATNVAETSLTVPGIRYVVDTGVARINRYSLAHQGAAAADRGDQPGVGQPALGPLRPRRGRHRDPALLRGGLRGAPGVHRSRDPADQPGQRHPADDRRSGSATSRGSRSSSRPTARNVTAGVQLLEELGALAATARRPPADPRRQAARPAADRPAAGPDDPRGGAARLPARGAGHRGGAVAAGPARAAGRAAAAGRPAARAVQGRVAATSSPGSTSGATCASSSASCPPRRSGGCASASTSTTCGSASGRTSSPSCARSAARCGSSSGRPADTPGRRRHPPGAAVRAALATSVCSRSGTARTAGRRRGPREYLGARGTRFAIFPGSGLKGKNPQFLMAGELVETGRLWARQNAAIRAGVGRADRQPPGQAHLLRAALVAEARGGDGAASG